MNHTTSFPPSTTRSYYFQSLTVSSYWLSDIKEKKCFTIFVCFVKNFLYWLFQRDKKTILITQVVIIKLKRLFRGYCNMELITSKYFHPVGITPCVESQFYIVFCIVLHLTQPTFILFNSHAQYLELRFNKVMRICGMLTFFLQMVRSSRIYLSSFLVQPTYQVSIRCP